MFTFWLIALFIFVGSILPSLVKWILQLVFKVSDEERKLREEYWQLKKELSVISAVDEFARYARTQRKLNKVEDDLKSRGQSRMDDRESIRWKLTKAIQAVNGAVLVYLAITQRYEPVLTGLSDWFWPLNLILSYPTGVEGALSTVFWLFICNNACRVLVK